MGGPVGITCPLVSPQAEEAGPGDGGWEGLQAGIPGLGQGAFLLSAHW